MRAKYLYALPEKTILLAMLLLCLLWLLLFRRIKQRQWRTINIVCAVLSLCGILALTVARRVSGGQHLFTFFAPYTNEFFREMLMNALLYFPLGLSLSVLIGPRSILAAFALSLGIECWQYFAGTGLAQGTDVLCNTLGCAIGAIPFWIDGILPERKTMKKELKKLLRPVVRKLESSWLAPVCYFLLDSFYMVRYRLLGRPHISPDDVKNVEENVTFIFKSFNRQKMARRLYDSIRAYYPGAAIVIADDSAEPLEIPGANIIHLPFNSGLSKGLIAALAEVKTEYVMRLDDDELLTPRSNIHGQLSFLQAHHEVNLCALQASAKPERSATVFNRIKMNKELLIPAGTVIDGRIVVYKAANCYLARTEKLREVGFDPNIRMIDHHEFFYRAAGVLVCVQDPHAYVYHYHNRFDREYAKYRGDTKGDSLYIRQKHGPQYYAK